MQEYLERFRAMVEELRLLPFVEVVKFEMPLPATEEDLEAVEKRLGAPLAGPLRDFYGLANGLELRWRIKPDLDEKEIKRLQRKSSDYPFELPEQDENPFAYINLLPLRDSIVRRRWKELNVQVEQETFEFGDKTRPYEEFRKSLKPFDLFSLYDCMAFQIEKGNSDPTVLLLSDYYIEWNNSRLTDFASYLEMLLVTRGIVQARDAIYADYRGDQKPPLRTPPSYWKKKHVPRLFRTGR
jgi:hypothetical protein